MLPEPDATQQEPNRALGSVSELRQRAEDRRRSDRLVVPQGNLQDASQFILPQPQKNERGMPNALALGAIFSAAKTGGAVKRVVHESRLLASVPDMRIVYQGQELRQDDCSVFMALLFYQRDVPLGDPIFFTAYGMLRELGWSINTNEYKHLLECCTRLAATALSISFSNGAEGFTGSLLRSFAWRDEGNKQMSRWCARFETSIARFFEKDSYSIIDPRIRRKISGRAPLAQWLHNFYSTHREPFAMSVSKYHELTDSRAKDLSDFRSRLKLALERLVEHGFLVHWEIKDDIVHVKRVRFHHTMARYRTL